MTPWLCYGQTVLPANNTDNPVCHHNGLAGEADLPYVVPVGKELVIKRLQVESYTDTRVLAMFLWYGTANGSAVTNAMCSSTLAANDGTKHIDVDWHIPAGTQVNLRLQNVQPGHLSWTYGWEVAGELVDA